MPVRQMPARQMPARQTASKTNASTNASATDTTHGSRNTTTPPGRSMTKARPTPRMLARQRPHQHPAHPNKRQHQDSTMDERHTSTMKGSDESIITATTLHDQAQICAQH